jgi:H2-forming N5,N10-methylenetetrahydromethanopterin dehydrogenase-like enzyme
MVEYRPGKLNNTVDTLSHREEDIVVVHTISTPTFELFDKLRAELQQDPEAIAVCAQRAEGIA